VNFSSRFLLGNPGDYVWGRDGLDSIVSQLLNQIDGAGPPPLTKEKIQEIPTALISQDHLGNNVLLFF
jgi:E3 ubiquitin-protein ligase RNF115/126